MRDLCLGLVFVAMVMLLADVVGRLDRIATALEHPASNGAPR